MCIEWLLHNKLSNYRMGRWAIMQNLHEMHDSMEGNVPTCWPLPPFIIGLLCKKPHPSVAILVARGSFLGAKICCASCSRCFVLLCSPTTYSICRPSCREEGLIGSSECPTGTGLSGGSSAPGSIDHSGNVSYTLPAADLLLYTHHVALMLLVLLIMVYSYVSVYTLMHAIVVLSFFF